MKNGGQRRPGVIWRNEQWESTMLVQAAFQRRTSPFPYATVFAYCESVDSVGKVKLGSPTSAGSAVPSAGPDRKPHTIALSFITSFSSREKGSITAMQKRTLF